MPSPSSSLIASRWSHRKTPIAQFSNRSSVLGGVGDYSTHGPGQFCGEFLEVGDSLVDVLAAFRQRLEPDFQEHRWHAAGDCDALAHIAVRDNFAGLQTPELTRAQPDHFAEFLAA